MSSLILYLIFAIYGHGSTNLNEIPNRTLPPSPVEYIPPVIDKK
jgi:hypothetical protein